MTLRVVTWTVAVVVGLLFWIVVGASVALLLQ